MSFFGQIDPHARAEVRVEAGDELEEDGTRSFNLELAEANLTLMAIPWGFQPKLGRMRLRWGYLNEFHQHDRPFIDNPDVGVSVMGMLASALLDLPTGATVACMFGLLLLLWYSATYLRRAGGGVGVPSSHSIEPAFTDKGAAS